MRLQQVAAAKDESDRGQYIEPDGDVLTPALRVRDEVRPDQDEPADRGNEQRNVMLHAAGILT